MRHPERLLLNALPLFMATVIAASPVASGAENLFPDPGFEKSLPMRDKSPKGTWRIQGEFTKLEHSTEIVHSGRKSLHLVDQDAGNSNHTLNYVLSPAELKKVRGHSLTFSAWVKQVTASSPNVVDIHILVRVPNEKPIESRITTATTEPTGWFHLSRTIDIPKDAAIVQVGFSCANRFKSTAEAYFDDVSLTLDDKPTTPQAAPAPLAKTPATPENAPAPQSALARELVEHFSKPAVFRDDNRPRPVIKNGTFYLNGKPFYALGGFTSRTQYKSWPDKNPDPQGIGHFAYVERPSKEHFRKMGMNSTQVSAAIMLPGQALFGLDVDEKLRIDLEDNKRFIQDLQDMPIVMDFAFGYRRALHDQQPDKDRALNQHNAHWHQFIPYCPEHPLGNRYYKNYLRGGTISALENGANVYLWEIFNESSYQCACPYNIKEFARRMQAKYHTIEQANQLWGTKFPSFLALSRETDLHLYQGLWSDFMKFLSDRYREILKEFADYIRTIDQRTNVYFTEQSAIAGIPKERQSGMDYTRFADVLDVLAHEGGIGFGLSNPTAAKNEMEEVTVTKADEHWFLMDFYQALAKGKKPIYNNEHYQTRIENGLRVPSKREDVITSHWSEIMHGVSASFTYSYDKRSWEWKTLADARKIVEQPSYKSSCILNPYNYPPDQLDAWKVLEAELEPLLDKVMPFPRTRPATVAILFSYPTVRMLSYHRFKYHDRLYAWYALAHHGHYPVRVVFEQDIPNLAKDNIKVLLVPSALYASPEGMRAAEQFVANGGTILADMDAFSFDEYARKLPPFQEHIQKFASDTPAGIAAVRKALDKLAPPRHGRILLANGTEPSRSEILDIDRGSFKLLYFLNHGDLDSKMGRVQWFIADDNGPYHLVDYIRKRLVLNGKSSTWNKADLARGFDAILPGQERSIFLLLKDAPGPEYTPLDKAGLQTLFSQKLAAEKPHMEEFTKRTRELADKNNHDRLFDDVAGKKFSFVDLSKFANMGFADPVAGDKKGGWFDQGSNDFAFMPTGNVKCAGVPFKIITPSRNDGKGAIILYSPNRDFFPKEAAGIPVGQKAKRLYFLHTLGWNPKKGEPVVTYRIHYTDGSQMEFPCRAGYEIGGWWGNAPLANAKIALESSNVTHGVINLQCCRFANPHPEKAIRTLDIVSACGNGVPAVIAISLEL
ncbi:MAG: beta-galactosidase [Victivallales bacterium]|nr:beta-galactosidase [Victivallales bacterium]